MSEILYSDQNPPSGETPDDCDRSDHRSTDLNYDQQSHELPCIISSSCYPITLKFIDVSYKVKLPDSTGTTNATNLKQLFRYSRTHLSQRNQTINHHHRLPQTEKEILHGITGTVSPGEMLAILGPSGSGKSTLLSLLAGRPGHPHNSSLTGSILYNDKKLTKQIKKRTGFVTQDDILYPHLTVRETLIFCALLRLPDSLSRKEKVAVAESVISELGLSKCGDTVIGNGFIRGVSGGERKRVSIGHEMLVNPSLLILDEPTSGLDSTAAYRVVEVLGGLVRKGKTVVMAVHQPSSRVFQKFDSVLVMSEGGGVYFGRGCDVFRYFKESVGFSPAFPMNPADFLLDLANGVCHSIDGVNEGQEPNVKQTLISSYTNALAPKIKASCLDINTTNNSSSSSSSTALSAAGSTSSKTRTTTVTIGSRNPNKHTFRRSTWFSQFCILFQRSLKERRHESFNSLRILQVVAASVLSGAMWWHSDYRDIQDRLGLLFFISIFWGVFPSFNAVFAFPQDRAMLTKERVSGMYALSSYFMARVVGDIPMELLLPTLFITLTYWMTGLKPELGAFVLTLLLILGNVLVAQGLGLALGALIMDAKRASTIVTITMLVFVLTGGFYIHKVPGCLSWIKYVSITFYAYRLLIDVQYGGGEAIGTLLGCYERRTGDGGYSGVINVAACKFVEDDISGQISSLTSVGILLIMFVGYRLLAYLALKTMKV